MPFTQAEIVGMFEAVARVHGVDSVSWLERIRPPLIGSVRMRCPVDGSACHDLFCQRNGCQGDS